MNPNDDGQCLNPQTLLAAGGIELFVPGRICLFGEHSDWSGGYRRFNSEIREGCALVCGTSQGLYAVARRLEGPRRLQFQSPDGGSCELALDDEAHLREVAQSSSYYAYIAGTVLELGKHFRVGSAHILNYKSDLPIKKGLSSSASVCVLIVRALNKLYDLKLTVHGEMDIAYRGEINTPSRCGRLDQCVAFGQTVTKMTFDSDIINTEQVRVGSTLYLVIVDLRAGKDTREILKCLNEAYPFPRDDRDKALHALLGEVNLKATAEAISVISQERDPSVAAERLGKSMTEAQARWDADAVPLCRHELTAPTLHHLLECPALAPYVTGGKGVGSQGDGSAQLVCRSAAAQDEVMKIVQGLGMEPLRLTIPASKSVRLAVVPIAGFCPGMWPATKCVGPWLFPVRVGEAVKPAICWLCEDLLSAGLEKIIFVVNEATQAQMERLFKQREDVANLNGVPDSAASYDSELLQIGSRVVFVRQDRPTGIRDALHCCEKTIAGEPFVLAWGDHMTSSAAKDGAGCIQQLLAGFDGHRSVAAMHCIDKDHLHIAGVYSSTGRQNGATAPGGNPVELWPLSRIAEKPTQEFAEEHLKTPGLAEGMFLASFGQYVLTPRLFELLHIKRSFSEALDTLRQEQGIDGVMIAGNRWDLGNMSTYVEALHAQAGIQNGQKMPEAKRLRTV